MILSELQRTHRLIGVTIDCLPLSRVVLCDVMRLRAFASDGSRPSRSSRGSDEPAKRERLCHWRRAPRRNPMTTSRREFVTTAATAAALATLGMRGSLLAAAPAVGLIFPPLNYPIPEDATRLY